MKRPFFQQVCLLQVRRIIMISCLIQMISAGWTANLLAEEADTFASPQQQNDRLTMDRLEQFLTPSQFRETLVELLALSACETASDDDKHPFFWFPFLLIGNWL
jgi:hypothetical protein